MPDEWGDQEAGWQVASFCAHLYYLDLQTVRRRGRSKRSAVETFLAAIKEQEEIANTKSVMKADDGKVVRLDLRLTPRQTRHRRRVMRIQPATTYLQHDVDYKVQMRLIYGSLQM